MSAKKWLYFKILPDSLNEATMKQQMTSISDSIIVCLFQNYNNMWNKRTVAKGKRLRWFIQRHVTAKYSLTFQSYVFRWQKKTQKWVSIYHSVTHTMWKRFDNDVKRTTHMFEDRSLRQWQSIWSSLEHRIWCSGYICNHGKSTKSLRQRQSSINKHHEEAFDTIRKQHATKRLLRPTSHVGH